MEKEMMQNIVDALVRTTYWVFTPNSVLCRYDTDLLEPLTDEELAAVTELMRNRMNVYPVKAVAYYAFLYQTESGEEVFTTTSILGYEHLDEIVYRTNSVVALAESNYLKHTGLLSLSDSLNEEDVKMRLTDLLKGGTVSNTTLSEVIPLNSNALLKLLLD